MGFPLVPLNDFDALEAYAFAGAKEVYVGFYDDEWVQAFGELADINRMSGFKRAANAYTLEEVLAVVPYVHGLGMRMAVTFNAAAYSAEQSDFVAACMQRLAYAGVDGVIVSVPELVAPARANHLEVSASTVCGIYNAATARFYADAGAQRLILPRDLSLGEIREIVAAVPEVDYELFMMRNGCIYSDCHCLGMHGLDCGALCGEARQAQRTLRASANMEAFEETSDLYFERFHAHACGLCALWDLEQLGVSAYKVVGRSDDVEAICTDVGLVSRNVAIARECKSREEYLRAMEGNPWPDIVCDKGLNCYYPELWELRRTFSK